MKSGKILNEERAISIKTFKILENVYCSNGSGLEIIIKTGSKDTPTRHSSGVNWFSVGGSR